MSSSQTTPSESRAVNDGYTVYGSRRLQDILDDPHRYDDVEHILSRPENLALAEIIDIYRDIEPVLRSALVDRTTLSQLLSRSNYAIDRLRRAQICLLNTATRRRADLAFNDLYRYHQPYHTGEGDSSEDPIVVEEWINRHVLNYVPTPYPQQATLQTPDIPQNIPVDDRSPGIWISDAAVESSPTPAPDNALPVQVEDTQSTIHSQRGRRSHPYSREGSQPFIRDASHTTSGSDRSRCHHCRQRGHIRVNCPQFTCRICNLAAPGHGPSLCPSMSH